MNYLIENSKRFATGDIIKVYSKLSHISMVPIWHYGVVTGVDEVVHFNLAEEDMEIRIIQTDINKFINGGTMLQICQMSAMHKKYEPEEIARRALSQVGSDFGGYNLITNNCEHFANWCSCGDRFSNQIPVNEGTDHSISNKVVEKLVVEPVMQTLYEIDKEFDDFSNKTDEFIEKVNKEIVDISNKTDEFFEKLLEIRFPWE